MQGGHSCTDVLICTYLYWEQKCTAKCTDKSLFFEDVLLNVLGFLIFLYFSPEVLFLHSGAFWRPKSQNFLQPR